MYLIKYIERTICVNKYKKQSVNVSIRLASLQVEKKNS
jgi:hypothetical protein